MKFSLVGATTLACLRQSLCIEDGVMLLQNQMQSSEAVVQSLLPDMASLKDPHKSRAVLAQIQQSVSSLASDVSQITPQVQSLVGTVISTLRESALSPVESDHAVDQQGLDEASDFAALHSEYTATFQNLNAPATDTAISSQISDLQTCFQQEDTQCIGVDHCIDTYQSATYAWTAANNALMIRDAEVNMYWCEGGHVRTEMVFRDESENLFNAYNAALHVLENAQADQEANGTACDGLQTVHLWTIENCTQRESQVITASCSHHTNVLNELALYKSAYSSKVETLQNLRASVRLREADRKVEWDVLQRVICLLTTLTEDVVGSADGALAGSQASIDACSSMSVSTNNLDINYPFHPDMLGLPAEPNHPCGTEFQMDIEKAHTCTLNIENNALDEVNEFYKSITQLPSCDELCTSDLPASAQSPNLDQTYFLLVNPMSSAEFVLTANAGEQQWSATSNDGTAASGAASPSYTSADGVTSFTFLHGDTDRNQAYVDDLETKETTEASLLRLGGFLYSTAEGETTVKLIAPSTVAYNPDYSVLEFTTKVDMASEPACAGGFKPVLEDSWAPDGATEYCFQIATAMPCCSSGCFIFRFDADFQGYTCYGVSGL